MSGISGNNVGGKKRFNLAKMAVPTTTAVLEESDFLSKQEIEDGSIEAPIETEAREWIGLEVTVKKKLPIETEFKLQKVLQLRNPSDPDALEKGSWDLARVLSTIVLDWNIDEDEGQRKPITAESILSLDGSFLVALQKAIGKAATQGRISPNSSGS